ncbi:MAG: hypothetical protein L6435_14100 [Anaerolineae bacterium]|nr:hypothetical protein [Anaerolineae bacterium]
MNLRIAKACTYVMLALVCLTLVLGGVAQAAPPPDWDGSRGTWEDLNRLPSGQSGAGVYLSWDDPSRGLNPPAIPIVGGLKSFSWSILEPGYDDGYDWTEVDAFITEEAAGGKKAAISFAVYNGRPWSGQDPALYGIRIPSWVWGRDSGARLYNTYTNDGWYVLNYLNETYLTEYEEFVNAFAQHLVDNPTLAANVPWVNITTGLLTETQPAANDGVNDGDNYYYHNIANWTSEEWVGYVNRVTDFYHSAFSSRGLPITLLLNMVPQFKGGYGGKSEREIWSDHAAELGVGLRNSGLRVDRTSNWIYSPLEKWCDPDPSSGLSAAPIGWEFYLHWTESESDLYWTVLCGLDKHPDHFAWTNDSQGWALQEPTYQPHFRLANKYSGVTRDTTPSVWVVLRERYSVWGGEIGNHNFWLWQDDSVPGGVTVPATNVQSFYYSYTGLTYYPTEYDSRIDPDPGNRAREGRYCRRTDQGTGNRYMYFNIDDRYKPGETEATFTVTYFDKGTDQWRLEYDAISNAYKVAATITKSNTNTWVTTSPITVYDARLNNNQSGGAYGGVDFRINSMNDGAYDEYIHIVHVTKGSGGTPTHDIPLSAENANLISLPLTPGDTSLEVVFEDIWTQFEKAYAYNAATGTWTSYEKGEPYGNDLTSVNEEMGLWVYVNSGCTLQASGSEPSSTAIPLYSSNANLVSWPSLDTRSVESALSGIWGQFEKAYAYNAATGTWTSYEKGEPYGNDLTQFEPGRGYWIYVNANCTWTISN